jgi:hypothetical protein
MKNGLHILTWQRINQIEKVSGVFCLKRKIGIAAICLFAVVPLFEISFIRKYFF